MTNAWRGEASKADQPIFGLSRCNVAGFDDIDALDDGVETAESMTFHEQTDQDAPTRMEKVPVLQMGNWVRVDKDGKVHTGSKVPEKTGGVLVPLSSDDSASWLAFSFMGKSPYDIRPDLLALVRQLNLVCGRRCIQYGANYLLASGHDLDMHLLQAAATDALLIFVYGETRGDGFGRKRADGAYTAGGQVKRHRPRRPTLHRRERQFKLANGSWATLRDAALKAYRRRYREAVTRYARVDNWRPPRNGRSFSRGFADPEWQPNSTKLEMIGPSAHLFHRRNSTVPKTDWISGRGRLTTSDSYNSK